MADEQKARNWWESVPGALTAVAAFIGAISGLVAGLNQLGVFHRSRTPEPVAAVGAPARDTVRGAHRAGTSAPAIRRSAPASAPASPSASPHAPSSAPATVPQSAGPSSPAAPPAPSGALPAGTVLELAATQRVCSTSIHNGDRFTGTVVVPIIGSGGASIPVGAQATLRVAEAKAPTFLTVSAESLSVGGRSFAISRSSARTRTEFTAGPSQTGVSIGACIPQGERISVTLNAPVTLGR